MNVEEELLRIAEATKDMQRPWGDVPWPLPSAKKKHMFRARGDMYRARNCAFDGLQAIAENRPVEMVREYLTAALYWESKALRSTIRARDLDRLTGNDARGRGSNHARDRRLAEVVDQLKASDPELSDRQAIQPAVLRSVDPDLHARLGALTEASVLRALRQGRQQGGESQ